MFFFFLQELSVVHIFAGSCSKADCTMEDWSEWEGSVEEGTCAGQKRTRGYTMFIDYESHLDECPSLPQECPKANEQTRAMCKSRER